MKRKDYIYLLVVFISCLIVVLVSIRFSNTFGSDTDWVNQHTVFPEYLRNEFYKTGKLIPNLALNYGGGQNIYNISYYGLLSPIILPSYLMPHVSMVAYMTIVNILIVLISSYLFYKWLHNNKFKSELCFVSTMLFVLSEALIFHMHRHIMFVNYMPFLIMSLMGIDSFFAKKKKSLFIISVFLMIMTSYYYSVGGILAIVCYYIYKYLDVNEKFEVKTFFKETFIALLCGILAVLMAAILLFPTIYTLLVGRGDNETTIKLIDLFVPYIQIHKIMSGTYAIGYSLIGFVGLLYLFFTKKKKNVIFSTIVSIILFIPIFRYLLNGGLYLREKCFIPFLPIIGLMISIFLNDLFNNKINIKKFSIYLLIIGILLAIMNNFSFHYLYILGLIIVLIYYSKSKNDRFVKFAIILVAFITCIVQNLGEDFVSIDLYKKFFAPQYEENINKILENDESYYRISNLMYPIKTVNKIYNERQLSTSFYTSTYNNYYLNFIRNVFKHSNPDFNYFFVSASDNTLFNTYMGVKYVYSPYDIGLGYEPIAENIYSNQNAFPLIYHMSNILSEKEFDNIDYPYNIEVMMNNVIVNGNNSNPKLENNIEAIDLEYELIDLNSDNIKITKDDDKIKIEVKKDDSFKIKLKENLQNKILFINLYGLNRNSCSNGNTYIKINNVNNLITCKSWIYHNKNEIFHYVISNEELEELDIEIGKGTYQISNIETFIVDYDYLANANVDLTEFGIRSISNDTIKGDIEILNDGYLVTSIPYDEGFTIKVNGKEYRPELVNKAFLGLKLDKGNFEIEITYKTPLLKEGKIVTLVSFVIFLVIFIIDLKNSRNDVNPI